MRCTPGARLALVLFLACAPAAWADGPLGEGKPCKSAQDVINAITFQNGFPVEQKACEKLCKKGRSTCAKHVNRAITCARKSIEDSTFFEIQVSCAGQQGSALKDCRRSFEEGEDGKKAQLAELENERDARLGDCDTKAQDCAETCDAP